MTDPAASQRRPTDGSGGRADRLANLVAPPVHALGGPWTLLTPLGLVFLVSLTASATTWAWAASVPPASGAALITSSGGLVWVLALLAPLAAALKGGLFAVMAWGVLVLLGGAPGVRPLVSALFYGEVILALQAIWVTAGALVLEITPPRTPGAMPIPSGLDAWVGTSGGVVLALAQQVTPFHLAWIAFLAVAFSAQGGVSRWRGLAAALSLWCLSAALAALRIP